ncbi:HEPN domain-containing protein [candidate division NPL-UPA2 bacterium]|nr:HEPN domain-containing protein [candidate division NPL-UPA2 bacterium]
MMQNEEVVKEWIEKAEQDFGFASTIIEHTDYFAQICFHFQQAAERYLKAFIIANGLEFRPVHNLLELLGICKQKEPGIEEIEEACRYLNAFYIDTRYPVHWPTQYDRETAVKARDSTEELKECIRSFLKFQRSK